MHVPSLVGSGVSSAEMKHINIRFNDSRELHTQGIVKFDVTLGLYRNQCADRIKGNQATFDNSQQNNLRSCVGFGGSVGEDVRAVLPSVRAENLSLIPE